MNSSPQNTEADAEPKPPCPQRAAALASELIQALEDGMEALRSISASLTQGFDAYTNLDLDGIVRLTEDQNARCSELQFFVRRWKHLSQAIADHCAESDLSGLLHLVEPEQWERIVLLVSNVAEVQAQVRYLNQLHGHLVRRSSRLATIMQNVIASAQGTYPPRAKLASPANSTSGA